MGEVYLAQHVESRQPAAVKIISAESNMMTSWEAQVHATQQFAREAAAIAALKHPHIVPIYGTGEQHGILYLIMPYLPFGSLADLLVHPQLTRYKLPLPPAMVVELIDQTASALQFAHDRGIMHLDVKPQNLLIHISHLPDTSATTTDQQSTLSYQELADEVTMPSTGEMPVQLQVLLADFGLARFITWISAHSGVAGTPLYTAPEQYAGKASPATDQYALAIVAYLLLTGQPVFNGTLAELHHQHLSVPPRPATDLNPQLPKEVNGVLGYALAKEPERRYQRIQEFAQSLRLVLMPSPLAEQKPWQATLPLSLVEKLYAPSAREAPQNPPTAFPAPPTGATSTPPSVPQAGPMTVTGGAVTGPTILPPGASSAMTGPTMLPPGASAHVPSASSTIPDPDPLRPPGSSRANPSLPPAPVFPYAGPAATSAPPMPPSPWASGQSGPPAPAPGQAMPPSTWASGQGSSPAWTPGPADPPTWATGLVSPPAQSGQGMSAPPTRPTQKQPFLKRLSLRQRLLFGGLALLVVLASIAAVLVGITLFKHPAIPPSQAQATQQRVTSFGTQTVASLPALGGALPQAQSTLPARLRFSGAQAAQASAAAANLNNLPALPQSLSVTLKNPANTPSSTPLPNKSTITPGQTQVGIDSPADISVAAHTGSDLVETIDGILVVNTHTARYTVSFASFFASMLHPNDVLGEARVLFDPGTTRWMLVMNQLQITGSSVNAGFFDVAFSKTSDPSGDWYLYQFSTQIAAYGNCTWADYPQIGTDAVGLFITGTSFACGQDGDLGGAALWELPKQNFAAGQAQTIFEWTGFKTGAGKPVVTLTPATERHSDKVEWLLSNDAGYADFGQTSTQIVVWGVDDRSAANQNTAPYVGKAVVTLAHAYADPPAAAQPGTAGTVATGDARIVQAQLFNGHLFAAFTTAMNWEGASSTLSGIYWLDLVPRIQSAEAITVQVAQQGLLGLASGYLFYPSFVVDSVVGSAYLFAEVSGPQTYPGLIFTSRSPHDPLNTLGNTSGVFLLQPGNVPFSGSHWGDYRVGTASANTKGALIWYVGMQLSGQPAKWQTNLWIVQAY
jgi:serine/threonine protein kinase